MGVRLKRLREAAGLSQVKLAAAVGVTPRSIQNYEYGKMAFDFELGVKIAEALGVSLDALAGKDEPAAKKKDGGGLFEKAPKKGGAK
jgi:transcriptional regulator with XRE-family HTH domain